MKRRHFITLVGGATAWPLSAHAQQMPKVAQMGLLTAGGSLETPAVRANLDVIRQGFTELGYVEGQNIILEQRAVPTSDSGFRTRPSQG
jgi:putative tryptophan/tyrosine transport system substrate-binding protein